MEITQVNNSRRKIKIEFFRGGRENVPLLSNVRLSASSEIQFITAGYIGFEQITCPF